MHDFDQLFGGPAAPIVARRLGVDEMLEDMAFDDSGDEAVHRVAARGRLLQDRGAARILNPSPKGIYPPVLPRSKAIGSGEGLGRTAKEHATVCHRLLWDLVCRYAAERCRLDRCTGEGKI
jgi:hypothetical protein